MYVESKINVGHWSKILASEVIWGHFWGRLTLKCNFKGLRGQIEIQLWSTKMFLDPKNGGADDLKSGLRGHMRLRESKIQFLRCLWSM